jgi:sigma-B regulation protein RsbU (phosphoserine phosphatase)
LDVFNHILAKVEAQELVVEVNVQWFDEEVMQKWRPHWGAGMPMRMGRKYQISHLAISSPKYNKRLSNRTVSLISELNGEEGDSLGRVEVVVSFEALVERIINAPWWRNYKAYLLDEDDNVLTSTGYERGLEDSFPMRVFGSQSDLERDTLKAISENVSGTVFGAGIPPDEVSGYYRLSEAPWTMVVIAPGKEVLKQIIYLRNLYVLAGVISIVIVLLFIRRMLNRVTGRIEKVSAAADKLARGKFGTPLRVQGRDEVAELTRNFNKMSQQLQQRLALKESINIAREVQQNLLPKGSLEIEGVAISGISLYCDETGGDYLDIMRCSDNPEKVIVIVGDVVGHGLGAALLMASIRALLRCRISLPGGPAEVIRDVNRLLYKDTSSSGSFVTLFYLEIDKSKDVIQWIRAGHEPAMIYTRGAGRITELKGRGLALGVDSDWVYECSSFPIPQEEQIILLGSDGAWEVENHKGQQFGKRRIEEILTASSDKSADDILKAITAQIASFRGDVPQNDDITLAVIKTSSLL